MTVNDGYTVAVSRHGQRRRGMQIKRRSVLGDSSQDLASLPFDFLFLAADVRHDVVQNVETGNTWVAGSGDRLHRAHEHRLQRTKRVFERLEWDDDTGRGAVRVGDDVSLVERQLRSLMRDDGQVRRVDEGYDERYEWVSTVVFRVREDDQLGNAEGGLCEQDVQSKVPIQTSTWAQPAHRYHLPRHDPTR